jgi:hypothetical protein
MNKIWKIITPTFTAEVTIDQSEVVAAADPPLEHLLGMPWEEARSYCIDRGWHGDRNPTHIRGKSGLKRRGWDDKDIAQYLSEPDATEPNPHHPGGKPMGLYEIRRVELVEQQWAILYSKGYA